MLRNALLVATAFLLPAVSHAQVKLLRQPTYSKGKVAFSYLGDIWTASENGTGVQRLTDNAARHASVWSRKHYRGAYAADLWVMDVTAKTFAKISGQDDYKGNWLWPMYGDGSIYFVSDRTANEKNIKFGGPEVMKSVNNIWKVS